MTATSVLKVQLKRLDPRAVIPQYQTAGAAAFDLHALLDQPLTIAPGETVKIRTGIAVSINNPGWALFLYARSGLGTKGLRPAHCVGIIDSDYQGELFAPMRNDLDPLALTESLIEADAELKRRTFTINPGDRIAQCVFQPVSQAMFREVAEFDHVTERGTGGFGSTGA